MSAAAASVRTASVLRARVGPITLLALHRPHVRNAVDRPTAHILTRAILDHESDESSKALVLTGLGGNFCAGADLGAIARYLHGGAVFFSFLYLFYIYMCAKLLIFFLNFFTPSQRHPQSPRCPWRLSDGPSATAAAETVPCGHRRICCCWWS
jgi:hypothetical protein